MKQSELIKKLENHPILKSFKEICTDNYLKLTGGAIIDIMDGRKPKDYDFIGTSDNHQQMFVDAGYKLYSDTRTAITYKNDGITVQFLKTQVKDFDYTLSQGEFNIKLAKLYNFDWISYDSRVLRCSDLANEKIVYDALMRLPHWYSKGFRVSNVSYKSMLRFVKNPPNDYSLHS